ncbi:MAG TPA: hypothetical protein VN680_04005 [Burkholderiaceae bacterium]|jgi:hypothetical protein|nr:hypothetical protein [Burkholderiaceae bacterium]
MKTPLLTRIAALGASICLTFSTVWLAAGYGYPEVPPSVIASAR